MAFGKAAMGCLRAVRVGTGLPRFGGLLVKVVLKSL